MKKKNVFLLGAAIAVLAAAQTGCDKPETVIPEPQLQTTAETNGPLTSLVDTKWYNHFEYSSQHIPTVGQVSVVSDSWYTFDSENTGTRIIDYKSRVISTAGEVSESAEVLTGSFDYIFDTASRHVFVNNFDVEGHDYSLANYEFVLDDDCNTMRDVSGNLQDSVYHLVR